MGHASDEAFDAVGRHTFLEAILCARAFELSARVRLDPRCAHGATGAMLAAARSLARAGGLLGRAPPPLRAVTPAGYAGMRQASGDSGGFLGKLFGPRKTGAAEAEPGAAPEAAAATEELRAIEA